MMNHQNVEELLRKYKDGVATEQEVELLLSLAQQWGVQEEVHITEEEYLAIQSELSNQLFRVAGKNRILHNSIIEGIK